VRHNPDSKHAGFHIDGFITPWVRWSDLASEWLKKKDDDEQRKSFFNTKLGLLYVGVGDTFDPTKLANRREAYPDDADLPIGVALLTIAIDVHGDRIECEVRGWGAREESWLIRLERFLGDPEGEDVWERARELINRQWKHAAGVMLEAVAVMVDSGYAKNPVFTFVKSMVGRPVYASKGADNAKQPLSRATKANRDGIKVFTIHPTSFKDTLFARLKRKVPGPGYLHFGPADRTGVDDAFFQQYSAEKRITEWANNKPVVKYVNPAKARNEAIDLYVLNLAALRSRGQIVSERLGELAEEHKAEGEQLRAAAERAAESGETPSAEPDDEADPRGLRERRGGGGWMSRM
jgi:phage terminase large subunit GpA-like protein